LGTFFPDRLKIALEYTDELTLSTGNSLPTFGSAIAFRLNSLYDPYFAAGGHQPYGFDQITPMYSRYLVDRVDIEVEFSDPTTDGMLVGAFPKNYYDGKSLTTETVNNASEWPAAWIKPLNDSGSQTVSYKRSIDCSTFMGLTRAQYEAAWDICGAITTADPSSPIYFEVAACCPRAPATQTVTVRVRLRFHCTFFARVMTSSS
jgi:hypothetical protein